MRFLYQGQFVDQSGNVVSDGTITIYLAGTTTLASVYTTLTGPTAVNSVTSDSNGYFKFYHDNFDYDYDQDFDIVLSKSGFLSKTYYNVQGEGILGNYTISTAKTITTNIKIPKGVIYVKSGTGTIVFNGPFEAGLYQVFSGFSAGNVTFGMLVKEVFPQWWGGDPTGVVDSANAINCAEKSGLSGYGFEINMTGFWGISSPIFLTRALTTFNGHSRAGSIIWPLAVDISGPYPNALIVNLCNIWNGTIKGLRLHNNGIAYTGWGISAVEGGFGGEQAIFSGNFEDLWVSLGTVGAGFFTGDAYNSWFHGIQFDPCTTRFSFVNANTVSIFNIDDLNSVAPFVKITTSGLLVNVSDVRSYGHLSEFFFDITGVTGFNASQIQYQPAYAAGTVAGFANIVNSKAVVINGFDLTNTTLAGQKGVYVQDSEVNLAHGKMKGITAGTNYALYIKGSQANVGAQVSVTQITAGVCTTTNTQGIGVGDDVQFGAGGTTANLTFRVTAVTANVSFKIDAVGITDATDVTCYERTPLNDVTLDDITIEGATTQQIATENAAGNLTISNSKFNKATELILDYLGIETINLTIQNSELMNAGYSGGGANPVLRYATSGKTKLVNNKIGSDNALSTPTYLYYFTGSGQLIMRGNNILLLGTTGEFHPSSSQVGDQVAFLAQATLQANVTGDGTQYNPTFATEIFDRGLNFNSATGIFTAPVTGRYLLSFSIAFADLAAGNTEAFIQIVTSNRTVTFFDVTIGTLQASGGCQLPGSLPFDMDAGDTAKINVYVAGGTKIVDVTAASFFSGHLVE